MQCRPCCSANDTLTAWVAAITIGHILGNGTATLALFVLVVLSTNKAIVIRFTVSQTSGSFSSMRVGAVFLYYCLLLARGSREYY